MVATTIIRLFRTAMETTISPKYSMAEGVRIIALALRLETMSLTKIPLMGSYLPHNPLAATSTSWIKPLILLAERYHVET